MQLHAIQNILNHQAGKINRLTALQTNHGKNLHLVNSKNFAKRMELKVKITLLNRMKYKNEKIEKLWKWLEDD